ncbi:hypothetical protein BDV29DRAFT_159070 [Aspergillus leporis]|uniref:Uncharacterized protein n=1 Tax=Aspergillus leporis TaxID=41062 RepID=A0A5N5WXB8_9EURO|nr:hypothetical protein BDV29DRAFT_159070 [Aspergillus leporis]
MTFHNCHGITVLHGPASSIANPEKDSSSEKISFDLVAIHGLNGDAIRTWSHDGTGAMWLRDQLSGVLPNV